MTFSYGDKSPAVDDSCFQAPDSVIIGDVTIGAESSIWFKAVIRGDINYVRIGSWTNIQDGCIVHVTGGTSPTEIGDYVTVGHGAVLHGCRIGNGCLVGMGAIVLDDAEIGDGSLIAAGTLVKAGMKVPSRAMVAGNPAVIKREISDKEARGFLDWARQYREYARGYAG